MASVALPISIGNSIMLNQATNSIAVFLPKVPRSRVQASIAGAAALFLDGVSDDQQTAILASIASTLGHIFYMVVAGGALAILLSMFMNREKVVAHARTGAGRLRSWCRQELRAAAKTT